MTISVSEMWWQSALTLRPVESFGGGGRNGYAVLGLLSLPRVRFSPSVRLVGYKTVLVQCYHSCPPRQPHPVNDIGELLKYCTGAHPV